MEWKDLRKGVRVSRAITVASAVFECTDKEKPELKPALQELCDALHDAGWRPSQA